MKKLYLFLITATISIFYTRAQTPDPDNAALALRNLKVLQRELAMMPSQKGAVQVQLIGKMLKLGVWDKASALISAGPATADYKLLKADYLILNNAYAAAAVQVNNVLKKQPANLKALQLKATLQIQAWRLPQAVSTCKKILKRYPKSEYTKLIMGRALLLQKKYPAALYIAKQLEIDNPNNAGAYLLEADVYFWDQHPEHAEAPLKKSLTIDPYNADARFSYGYAIWRRIDATQLNAMAAQWEIALAVNPLHFSTNWHWGNGHTNLTYADYAQKDDEEVRKALAKADTLFAANKINEAIAYTRVIQSKYPDSVLPLMHRASLYYSAFDWPRHPRLDSAEAIFRQVLARKKHYGPAHNGLAAVIKSERIPYLRTYDSITHKLRATKITDRKNYEAVFPDMSYYPGSIAKAMVWNQMYAARVYFPFLAKQGLTFRASPLHIDLAITMKDPSFRYITTFDNRQWMDIRGVGSGAADIEYVERGAYQERNVILHEYTHLYHYSVLTDQEQREVRAHYYKAMAEHRTLDYYSQNNEAEYFAQTYPAFFEPVKVHPVDFKSMNTTGDLKKKDPGMYDFIAKLVKKQKAYLAGNKNAMADNWAQVYVNLSEAHRDSAKLAVSYLDTALRYDNKYLPAFLNYARFRSIQGNFVAAEVWLKRAQVIDARYAPIYVAYADLIQSRGAAGQIDKQVAVNQQADYLTKALELEDDYQERAADNIQLRNLYQRNGQIAEAIATADAYIKTCPTVSTYLRDSRDDAAAFAASLRSDLGYPESIPVLGHLVEQNPQKFEYRTLYANALAANKDYDHAISTLQQAQRILKASGNGRIGFDLQIAEYFNDLNMKDSVKKYEPASLQPTGGRGRRSRGTSVTDGLRYARLLAATGKMKEAEEILKSLPSTGDNAWLSDYAYTLGKIKEASKPDEAAANYESAIRYNPYQFKVYPWLINYYNKNGQTEKIDALKSSLQGLKIQPGPGIGM